MIFGVHHKSGSGKSTRIQRMKKIKEIDKENRIQLKMIKKRIMERKNVEGSVMKELECIN